MESEQELLNCALSRLVGKYGAVLAGAFRRKVVPRFYPNLSTFEALRGRISGLMRKCDEEMARDEGAMCPVI